MCDDLHRKFMETTSYHFHLTKLTLQHVSNIIHCITIYMGHLGIVCMPHDSALLLLCISIGCTQITWVKLKTTLNEGVGEEVAPKQRCIHGTTQHFAQNEIESFVISLFNCIIRITLLIKYITSNYSSENLMTVKSSCSS